MKFLSSIADSISKINIADNLVAIKSFVSPKLEEVQKSMNLSLNSKIEQQVYQEIETRIKTAKRSKHSVINSIVNKHLPEAQKETSSILIQGDVISDWNSVAPIEKLFGLLRQNGYVLISENPLEIKIE